METAWYGSIPGCPDVLTSFLFQATLKSHNDSLCDLYFEDSKLVTGSRDRTVKGTLTPLLQPSGFSLTVYKSSMGLLVACYCQASAFMFFLSFLPLFYVFVTVQ